MANLVLFGVTLQTLAVSAFSQPVPRAVGQPHLIPLRREAVPVIKKNQTVSHKSAYFGTISVGSNSNGEVAQEFSVVFDTGSGHIVLPSETCDSQACHTHRRYDISSSNSAQAINADGTEVPANEPCDQVNIGFGTGTITGELVRETVCLGEALCTTASVVAAVEMSDKPFLSFSFDGIFGLGLSRLSLAPEFNFLSRVGPHLGRLPPRFGVFLTDRNKGMGSEIALGGYNEERIASPISWTRVARPELGFWQVKLNAIWVDDVELDLCSSGDCYGILDTGTSHFGVPNTAHRTLANMLSVPEQGEGADCKLSRAPTLHLDVEGFRLSLFPEDYMRPSVTRSSSSGNKCTPKLMSTNIKAPLGPNLFLLGEPLLLRYYTVYDWETLQVGFGLTHGHRQHDQTPGGFQPDNVVT